MSSGSPSLTVSSCAESTLETLRARSLMIATAESCTGGLIAGALTAIAGSSDVVAGGFVTYSNDMKMRVLDVPEAMLRDHGAVSEEVARAMAEGAQRASAAPVTVAVTGIAGPGGATPDKPVGLVHFACHFSGQTHAMHHVFAGDRQSVREQTVICALQMVSDIARQSG